MASEILQTGWNGGQRGKFVLHCPGANTAEKRNIMDTDALNRELLDFLDHSPNCFFVVKNMTDILMKNGFQKLSEGERWKLEPGGNYFVTRNGSSLIAFRLPEGDCMGFQLMASHSDSPTFRVKTNPTLTVEGEYLRLNTERYGGMILSTWLDRPLSIAGRVLVKTPEGLETRLVNIDRDLLVIPNLAIHMDRSANDGYAFNAQQDMLPLLGAADGKRDFRAFIAEAAGCNADDLIDGDLSLYNRTPATFLGLDNEFIASGRLDDQQCAFSSLKGLLLSRPKGSAAVHCVFDNEEIGSRTSQGAGSLFLRDTLARINAALGGTPEDLQRRLGNSFMVSADNAHSVHPNHPDKADPSNRPFMNGGVVIKYAANQKYATDGVSSAIFRMLCERAKVPVQTFANRSDMPGGSTLGTIADTFVPVITVDVGLAQLAMHSAWETAGAKDTAYLVAAARELFSTSVRSIGDGKIIIQ